MAFENNVSIDTSITKNVMLKCNKSEIDEVISILLDNAIKHSYKNSIISINLYKENKCVIIVTHSEEVCKSCDEVYALKSKKDLEEEILQKKEEKKKSKQNQKKKNKT